MTTYNSSAVSNAAIAFQKPITLQQGRAFRDNLLAVAEADSSVPPALLPTVLIASAPASGSSVVFGGLVLTPYKSLRVGFRGVSFTGSGSEITLAGTIISAPSGGSFTTYHGLTDICLLSGAGASNITGSGGVGGFANGFFHSITTATTSITIGRTGINNFGGGTIYLIGLK